MNTAVASMLRHRHVEVDRLDFHLVETGESNGADFLLLHGWPEDWSIYERLLELLGTVAHAVAIDLPGIGGSMTPPRSGEKRWLAVRIANLIRALGFRDVTLAGPHGVSVVDRERYATAYARRTALQTGFGWYRAYAQDEKENRADHGRPVHVPVLVLRGDKETGTIADYIEGLRRAGCAHVESAIISDCGHFAPSEQPGQVVATLQRFAQVNTTGGMETRRESSDVAS